MAFKIGDYVIHKSIGVCKIDAIKEQDFGFGLETYFVIVPHFASGNASNNTATMVNTKNTRQLRECSSKKVLQETLKIIPTLTSLWINDSKKRKEMFLKILSEGDLVSLCQLIRTVYLKKIEYVDLKKNVPITDTTYAANAEKLVIEEFAIGLNKDIEEIRELLIPKFKYIEK